MNLTTKAEGAVIYVTVDGSEPTEGSGMLYDGPVAVGATTTLRAGVFRPGELSLRTMRQIYLFLEEVHDQADNPLGFPSVWRPSLAADYGLDDSTKVGTRVEIRPTRIQ